MRITSLLFLSMIFFQNHSFSQCTPAIIRGSASINTPGYLSSNTFTTTNNGTQTANIPNLSNGMLTFTGTVSGTAQWAGGVHLDNDPVAGDYIFVQPKNTGNAASGNVATYTFQFSEPLYNLSFRSGGLNNFDYVKVDAFIGATPIAITPTNFSDVSNFDGSGGITFSGNTATSTNTGGGVEVISNRFTTTIAGPVDKFILTTGKANGSSSNVTLGFTTFEYTRCVKVPPDLNATFVNTAVTGNVGTNDIKPTGTTYGVAATVPGNPGPAIPTINTDGTYSFTSAVPGIFQFLVPMCPPSVLTADCPKVLLKITVNDPNSLTNIPVANIDRATTPINTAVTLNTLANDLSGNKNISLNPASVTVTTPPLHGTTSVNPATGAITFTPTTGYTGYDTLTYQVCDQSSPTPYCTTSKQIITIEPAGAANSTVASDDYNSGSLNAPLPGNVKLNDIDPQSNTQTVTAQPSTLVAGKGTLVLNTDGTYIFTPVSGFFGPVSFPYQTCDNGAPVACSNATLYILIKPSNTLPLDLLSFSAKTNNGNTALTWISENQVNVDHFEIERSVDIATAFNLVGRVDANSGSSGIYYFTDIEASRNFTKGYYRLKIVDIDNRFTYSKILLVNFGKKLAVDIWPTIVRTGEPVNISVSAVGQPLFAGALYNMSGQVLQNWSLLSGNSFQLETQKLPKGIYLVKVNGDNQQSATRIIIQ